MAELVSPVESEFILREAWNRGVPLRLQGSGKSHVVTIQDIRKDIVLLALSGAGEKGYSLWEPIAAYFDFLGKEMTFRTKILRLEEVGMHVAFPERLMRSPARRHPRVPPPNGFAMEITLQNEKLNLEYPQCGEYSDVSLPDLHEGFDIGSFTSLIESFRVRANSLASESRVVLFKGRSPKGIEENLVAHFGKTLFIPSTRNPLPSEDPYPDSRLLTPSMIEAYERPNAAIEGSDMDRAIISKIGRGISAEVWCPILYYQYIVGYVYMANKTDRPAAMSFAAVDCAWEFSRVLAFYLKTHEYFRSDQQSEPVHHAAVIVDMSASGCLLSIPRTTLAMRVKTGALLEMRLSYPEGSFEVRGRVVRRYEGRDGVYYGVSFQDLEPDILRELFPRIYQIPYAEAGEDIGEACLRTSAAK